MNRFIAHAVAGVLLLVPNWAAVAGETGMSHDDTVNPGAPPPHIAPPGGSTSPQPLSTNTTPRTGATPLPSGLPPREVQPGEETPQAEDQTRGQIKRPLPGTAGQSGGGDGTQTEDELYVGRKAGGGSVSSGDEDEFEDLQVERRTVQGAEKPGVPSQGPSAGPGGQGVGLPPRRKEGPMVRGAPTPGAPAPGADVTASKRGPNCGTFWTTRVEDPEVNVNPCPKNCTRGERQLVNTYKQGNKTLYEARYQCHQMATVPQSKGGAALAPDNSPPARARAVIEKPAAVPAGTVAPASGPWGIFARLKGPRFGSADSVRALWYPNDDVTKPPAMSQSATIYRRHGTDEIEIQLPRDPAKSGFSGGVGNFSSGPLHILLFMPDEKTIIYAGRYEVDSGLARKKLRKKAGADVTTRPASSPPTLSTTERPTGGPGGLTAGGAAADVRGRAGADLATRPTAGRPTSSPPTLSATERPTGGTQGVQVAGGETVSTQPEIGGAPRELNRPAAADREISTRNIVPGPMLLAVTGEDATTARVSWRPLAGASSYKAHAAAKGLNHSVAGREVRQPTLNSANQPGLPDAITYNLSGLAPGVEHNVWVTVNYPDGRSGPSDTKTVTTKAGENPKNFRAFASATGTPGSVRLEWQVVPGVTHYFVEGSNLPRTQTTNAGFVVPDIRTAGTHEWTVISVYPGGLYNDLNPSRASLVVGGSPAASDRARYRITVNGFRVNRETLDDPLQRDGKGDEVYIAVYVAEHDTRGNRLSSNVIRPPVVFGDKSGFGSGRVSAGSRSGSGGLRSGDGYPGANPATRTRGPSPVNLPFTVWQGELAAAGNYVVMVPSIWEWDGNSQDFDGWANVVDSSVLAVRERLRQVLQPTAGNPPSGWPGIHLSRASFFTGGSAGDRPIGLRASPQGGAYYEYFDRAFALNREFVEAKLTKASQTSLPPGVASTRFEDDPSLSHVLGGDYTLYLQVERLQ